MKIIPEITNVSYQNYLNHDNGYLEKHNLYKKDGRLYTFVKFASFRKKKVEVVPPSERENILKELYKDPLTRKNGRDSFFGMVRERYANIPRDFVFNWLKKQESYQLHLMQPREKLLRPISDRKINSKWQMDLVDMKNHTGPNNSNKKYILTVIDVFSKYAFVRAMPNKKANTTGKFFEEILKENYEITGGYPKAIQSDRGKEFLNKKFQELAEEYKFVLIISPPYLPQAQGIIERFNKTLKRAIYLNFSFYNNTKWALLLPDIIKNYNNTIHNTIKDAPVRIHKAGRISMKQQKIIRGRRDDWVKSNRNYEPLKVGDKVRIHILTNKDERKEAKFKKKYIPQWSKTIYEVYKITGEQSAKVKPSYVLYDGNETVKRNFYRHDLQKIKI